jgi:hypothetical protein
LDGTIIYISLSYGGVFNDDYIVRKKGENWLPHLNLKENGMRDLSFENLSKFHIFLHLYSVMNSIV